MKLIWGWRWFRAGLKWSLLGYRGRLLREHVMNDLWPYFERAYPGLTYWEFREECEQELAKHV